ncbi:Small ribosomal subunit protein uS2 [Entamoeba marina]
MSKGKQSRYPDILKPSAEDIKMMVACRVHIGSANCNFGMEEYVYSRGNNNECIFDLMKTWEKLTLAARVIAGIAQQTPNDVIAVAGREMAHRASLKFMKFTHCTSIAGKFTPGSFTNQIQKKFMEPRLIIVSDPSVDHQALRESTYINVPTIAFCNSDNNLQDVDIAIPCNNRSRLSIGLMWWLLTREILRYQGVLARDEEWDIMVDLFLHRELDAKKEAPQVAGVDASASVKSVDQKKTESNATVATSELAEN